MTQQIKYKVSGPVITEKKFVKNRNGNYVLSYNVSAAKIQKGKTSKMMLLSEYADQQQYSKPKILEMNQKSRVNNILNRRDCF